MMTGRERTLKGQVYDLPPSAVASEGGQPNDDVFVPAAQPATHGLLVALIRQPEQPRIEATAWPLWLVPGLPRRDGELPFPHSHPLLE